MKHRIIPLKRKNTQQIFKKYLIPASLELAETHYEVSKIGKDSLSSTKEKKTCPCCLKSTKEDYSLMKSSLDITDYGLTIPLYSLFTKFVLTFFTILSIGSGAINYKMFQLNYKYRTGIDKQAEPQKYANEGADGFEFAMLYDHSALFYKDNKGEVISIVVETIYWEIIAAVLMAFFTFYFQFKFHKKVHNEKNERRISAADFTIMVGNVNKMDSEKDIQDFLNQITGLKNLPPPRIVNMTIGCYKGNIKILGEKITELENQIKAIRDCIQERGSSLNWQERETAYGVIKDKEKEIEAHQKNISKKINKHLNMADNVKECVAFVTLATTIEKDWVLYSREKYSPWFIRCFKKKKKYKILNTSNPENIYWEKIGYDTWHRKKITIFTWIFLNISLCVFILLILGTYLFKDEIDKKNKKKNTSKMVHSFFNILGFPILIASITQIYIMIMQYVSKTNRYLSKNDLMYSTTHQLILVRIVIFYSSQIIFMFQVKYALFGHTYNEDSPFEYDVQRNAASVDIFNFFLMMAFNIPLGNLFNPDYFLMLLNQWWVKRKLKNSERLSTKYHWLTQSELNGIFDRMDWNIEHTFSVIVWPVLMITFFTPFIKILPVIGIIFLLLQKAVDKMQMFRRFKAPPENVARFSKKIMDFLCYVPRIYVLSLALEYKAYLSYLDHDPNSTKKREDQGGILSSMSWIVTVTCAFILLVYAVIPSHCFFEKKLSEKFWPYDKQNILLGRFLNTLLKKKFIEKSSQSKRKKLEDYGPSVVTDYSYKTCAQHHYSRVKHLLLTDYDRMNPSTQVEATDNWKDLYLRVSNISFETIDAEYFKEEVVVDGDCEELCAGSLNEDGLERSLIG